MLYSRRSPPRNRDPPIVHDDPDRKKGDRARSLTLREVARELDIPWASLEGYANGRANPRADTLEVLAEKLGVPITELVSGSPPGWEQAETIVRAAVAVGSLPPEHHEECVELFLKLVALFLKGER